MNNDELWNQLHEQELRHPTEASYNIGNNSNNSNNYINIGIILFFIVLICILIYIFINHNKK